MANWFTVAEVLAFARSRPANETYDFIRSDVCALGQFAQERRGYSQADAQCQTYRRHVPEELFRAVLGKGDPDWTWGALVTRLEALVQETPAKPSPWLNPQTYVDADCGERVL